MSKPQANDRARAVLAELMADPFLSRNQVLQVLNVSSATLYRMIERSEFPPGSSRNGRGRFWRASIVRRYQTLIDLDAACPHWWQRRTADRPEPPSPPSL